MNLISFAAKLWPKRRRTEPVDPLTGLKDIVGTGLAYEDEFITIYMRVLRDEGFLEYFGENAENARSILTALIDGSAVHKAMLEKIMNKVS